MTLANMREQEVQHLIAYCHNDTCRHQALIDVSSYPGSLGAVWTRHAAGIDRRVTERHE
jgi:hypothetical protein